MVRRRPRNRTLALLLALYGCSGSATTSSAGDPVQPQQAPAAQADEAAADVPDHEAKEAGEAGDQAVEAPSEPTANAAPPEPEPPEQDPWLVERLRSRKKIARLLEDPERYRFQVLVTVIQPQGKGKEPKVTEHGYRVDAEYIYPASAIKTFASVGALLKLEQLRAERHKVGVHTPVAYCEGDSTRCKATDESNVDTGLITIGHEIRKMQLVSNNVAFNRLYELVGHRELNEQMWALGFKSFWVHHRMYGVQDELAQRTTPRIELRPKRGKTVVVPARVSDLVLPPTESRLMQLGVGYIDDATHSLVEEPLDFSRKNYVSVRDLHRLTMALVRPDLPGAIQLGLDPSDRKFLLEAMTDDPLQSANPVYDNPHDSGLRYHTMIKGMMTVVPLDEIRYVGKAGRAYGFHLDNAYIEHTKSKRAMVESKRARISASTSRSIRRSRPFLISTGIV